MHILSDIRRPLPPVALLHKPNRFVYAYNTAPHESLGGISPYEVYHGVAARNPFDTAVCSLATDAELPGGPLDDPAVFAAAVKIKTPAAAFTRLTKLLKMGGCYRATP
jgi:hypothetical protein